VAQRLAASQARILALLGGSLAAQAAGLLAEEAVDGRWNCRSGPWPRCSGCSGPR